jgi:hypothetical protein
LTKRALKAIPLILSLQNEGQSIDRLYKKGMLTDDMHFRVKELKAFVDQEYQDVQAEANELMEGWGEHVWQQAMQTHMVCSSSVVLSSTSCVHLNVSLYTYRLFRDNLKAQSSNVTPWLKHLQQKLSQRPRNRPLHRRPLRLTKIRNPSL